DQVRSRPMGPQDSWLQRYLLDSVKRNLCTQIFCTTCGAAEFRRGLFAALTEAIDGPPVAWLNASTALALTKALSAVKPVDDGNWKLEEAVRLILFEIWRTAGEWTTEEQLQPILSETWAG